MSLFFSTGMLLAAPPDVSAPSDAYAATVSGIDGLIAWWRLGDASTSLLADASGNGRTGSYAGTPAFGVSDLTEAWQASDGRACNFAGNGYGAVPHSAVFALSQGTLSFWGRANSLSTEQIFVGKDQAGLSSPDDQFACHVATDGRVRAYFQRGSTEVGLESIPGLIGVGEAHHYCFVWSSTGVYLWVDGRYVAKSYAHRTGLVGNNLPWRFGIRTYDGTLSDVRVDEVALYNRALTMSEIQALSQYVGGLYYRNADALRTVNVSTASALTTALSNAQPGDHIVLANGTYSGDFNLNANGTKANPIVIRSANGTANVTISGTTIDLHGRYGILDGVSIAAATTCRVYGQRCRATRIRHDNRTTIGVQVMAGAHFSRVDHCEIGATSDNSTGTRHGIRVQLDGPNPADCPWYTLVDHSLARGATMDVEIGTTPIVLGNDKTSRGCCHVHKCLVDLGADSGAIELKNSTGMVSHCTMTGGVYGHNRHGADCEWRSCYYRIDHNAYGRGHLMIGCTFNGSGIDLRLPPGGATQADFPTSTAGYPASENVAIVGCRFLGGAKVLAGSPTFETGVKAGGATAEGCINFAVTHTAANYEGTLTHTPTTTQPYEVAVELTASDVGLAAADPLVPPGWR